MFANVNVTKLTWLIKYCQTMLHNKINNASWEKKTVWFMALAKKWRKKDILLTYLICHHDTFSFSKLSVLRLVENKRGYHGYMIAPIWKY